MMRFLDLVKKRQSDRGYEPKNIEQDKLERILECARLAPSACNAQPWRIVVVTDPAMRESIARSVSSKVLGMNHFSVQAPVHLVIVEEKANFTSSLGSWIKKKHFPLIDIGIFAEHICLAAADEGLGSCMIGWFNEVAVKKLLSIPKSKRVPLIITLGYSSQSNRLKKRKTQENIVCYNRYSQK